VKFDGRLTGDAVAELARVSESATPPLTVDLSDMQFADGEGVDALEEIRGRGGRLCHVPPYVSLLLELKRRRGTAAGGPGSSSEHGALRRRAGAISRDR